MIIVCLRYSSGNVRLPDRRLYTHRPHADFGRDDHREDAPHFKCINMYFKLCLVCQKSFQTALILESLLKQCQLKLCTFG